MLSLWLVVVVPVIWWGIDVFCLAPLEVVQVPRLTPLEVVPGLLLLVLSF
jgi:hypothetical protein